MAYTQFRNGFKVTTEAAIDERIILTKAQMLTAEDDYSLPPVYLCICPEDGKLYLYNVNNVPNNDIGKFRLIDNVINFESEEVKENIEPVIAESPTIQNIKDEMENFIIDGEEVIE